MSTDTSAVPAPSGAEPAVPEFEIPWTHRRHLGEPGACAWCEEDATRSVTVDASPAGELGEPHPVFGYAGVPGRVFVGATSFAATDPCAGRATRSVGACTDHGHELVPEHRGSQTAKVNPQLNLEQYAGELEGPMPQRLAELHTAPPAPERAPSGPRHLTATERLRQGVRRERAKTTTH